MSELVILLMSVYLLVAPLVALSVGGMALDRAPWRWKATVMLSAVLQLGMGMIGLLMLSNTRVAFMPMSALQLIAEGQYVLVAVVTSLCMYVGLSKKATWR